MLLVQPSAVAAAVRLPQRATASKASTSSGGGIVFIFSTNHQVIGHFSGGQRLLCCKHDQPLNSEDAMNTLRRLLAYWSNHWSLLPEYTLDCHHTQLEDLRHEAERYSRGRWL
jgi:hypothetical protein